MTRPTTPRRWLAAAITEAGRLHAPLPWQRRLAPPPAEETSGQTARDARLRPERNASAPHI